MTNSDFKVEGMSTLKVEKRALDILARYCQLKGDHSILDSSGGAVDIFEIADTFLWKAKQYKICLESDDYFVGCEAKTCFTERIVYCKASDFVNPATSTRGRFTIAHEIIHVWFHSDQITAFKALTAARSSCDKIEIYESAEWQANKGGAALLIPFPALDDTISRFNGPPPLLVKEVANRFNVSLDCAEKRIETYYKYLVRKKKELLEHIEKNETVTS